jgi:IS30 family transposase
VDRRGRNANPFYQEFLSLLELLPLLKSPSAPKTSRPPRKQDQTRLEADEASELIQRCQAGDTVYDLSKRFNVHRQTVSTILKRNDVRLRRSQLRESEVDRAIDLYASGLSLSDVGSRLGKSAGTIRRVLIANGIATRDSHGRPMS